MVQRVPQRLPFRRLIEVICVYKLWVAVDVLREVWGSCPRTATGELTGGEGVDGREWLAVGNSVVRCVKRDGRYQLCCVVLCWKVCEYVGSVRVLGFGEGDVPWIACMTLGMVWLQEEVMQKGILGLCGT